VATTYRECHDGHTASLDADNVYILTNRAIGAKREALEQYRDVEFQRKCMVQLAVAHGLDLNNDFIMKAEVERQTQAAEKRGRTFAELVDWVKAQELVPFIDGRPPRLGTQQLCGMCADPHSNDELWTFDRRLLSNQLHPNLTRASADQETVLEGRSFCAGCFAKITGTIDQISARNNMEKVLWEEGRTHQTLKDLFAKIHSRPR
jgi:hypothetical protein